MTLAQALKIHSAFGAIRELAVRKNVPEIVRICNDTLDDAEFLVAETNRKTTPAEIAQVLIDMI